MANSSIITILKQKIKNEIVNDPLIVKVIGSPNYDNEDLDFSGEDVEDNYILTWNKYPETITDTITFITLQVHINRYRKNWVKPRLDIWIYSHNEHMTLPLNDFPGITANRNDYLSQLIDLKFNGRNTLGLNDDVINLIGRLELTSNTEGAYNSKFVYRHMTFETVDLNDSLCDTE